MGYEELEEQHSYSALNLSLSHFLSLMIYMLNYYYSAKDGAGSIGFGQQKGRKKDEEEEEGKEESNKPNGKEQQSFQRSSSTQIVTKQTNPNT